MSCIMFSDDRIAGLADFIAAVANCGFDRFGFSIPQNLEDALHFCRDRFGCMQEEAVFSELYALNMDAFCARYNEAPDDLPEMPEKYEKLTPERRQGQDDTITQWYEDITPKHYQVLKLLNSFLYQCDEGSNDKTLLYKGLAELIETMQYYIISNTPAYIKAAYL